MRPQQTDAKENKQSVDGNHYFSFTELSLITHMLLLLFSLMSFVVLVLFMKIVSLLSHFFVEFTGNVNIDLTGAIQMFTNTGTSV